MIGLYHGEEFLSAKGLNIGRVGGKPSEGRGAGCAGWLQKEFIITYWVALALLYCQLG